MRSLSGGRESGGVVGVGKRAAPWVRRPRDKESSAALNARFTARSGCHMDTIGGLSRAERKLHVCTTEQYGQAVGMEQTRNR